MDLETSVEYVWGMGRGTKGGVNCLGSAELTLGAKGRGRKIIQDLKRYWRCVQRAHRCMCTPRAWQCTPCGKGAADIASSFCGWSLLATPHHRQCHGRLQGLPACRRHLRDFAVPPQPSRTHSIHVKRSFMFCQFCI